MTLSILLLYLTFLCSCILGSTINSTPSGQEHHSSIKSILESGVSLRGGSKTNEGNVFLRNLPVCDADWDLMDAHVVCRMLGHFNAVKRTRGSTFGKVSKDFGIGNVNCSGKEQSLLDCPHEDGKVCRSCKAAGVVCEPGFKMELQGGSGENEGQVFFGNRPVCDKNWSIEDADLVCKLLGFQTAVKATRSSEFGTVPNNFIMDNVNCLGNESSLMDCAHGDGKTCGPGDGAGVVCFNHLDFSIRLEDGNASYKGNVFIGHYSVCSDGWDIRDANVACRMLGYPGAEESFSYNLDCDRQDDNRPYMITNVGCAGVEHSLRNCPYTVNNNCSGEYAGVVCYQAPFYDISLSNQGKSSNIEGNIYLKGRPICDDLWDRADATVACKMLGLSGSSSSSVRSAYGKVPLNFKNENNFKCTGSEKSLLECPSKELFECGEHEGAGLKCNQRTSSYKAKLVGGTLTSSYYSGNVYFGSHPLCHHNWDMNLATHVCRLLGYAEASEISYQSTYGDVPTSSMVYDLQFKGLEWRLEDCSYKMDGDCPRSKGAGVVCRGYRVELRGGSSTKSGEVFINGQPISFVNWGLTDANVACKMLGFSGALSFGRGSTYYRTYYKMFNVGCTGDEDNLADCSHTVNQYTSSYVATVDCFY